MGHESFLRIGETELFLTQDGYDPELAAVFTEDDRVYEDDRERDTLAYGYGATARQVRQRLQLQGFSATRAMDDLRQAVHEWHQAPDPQLPPPCDVEQVITEHRRLLDDPFAEVVSNDRLDLLIHLDRRALLRVLLDMVPEQTDIVLDLSQLLGCCVDLDPEIPIAKTARARQLHDVALNAPMIVLTEGKTDSRLLSKAMKITHPHLIGFVNFIDFDAAPAQGSASALVKTAYSFIAAGVANRFIAIADNDTASHAELASIKADRTLPSTCRILHYPDLPFLRHYPTLGPYSDQTVHADINGRAASLELYLGRDTLTIAGALAPIQWESYNPKLRRYHGGLIAGDKRTVQQAFESKTEDALHGAHSNSTDWTGVHAIVESIVDAFD